MLTVCNCAYQGGSGHLTPQSSKKEAPTTFSVSSMPTETLQYEIHENIAENAKMLKNEGTVYSHGKNQDNLSNKTITPSYDIQ